MLGKIIIVSFILISFASCSEKKGSLDNDTKLVLKEMANVSNGAESEEDCDEKAKKANEIKIDESGELDLAPSEDEGCSLEEAGSKDKSPI